MKLLLIVVSYALSLLPSGGAPVHPNTVRCALIGQFPVYVLRDLGDDKYVITNLSVLDVIQRPNIQFVRCEDTTLEPLSEATVFPGWVLPTAIVLFLVVAAGFFAAILALILAVVILRQILLREPFTLGDLPRLIAEEFEPLVPMGLHPATRRANHFGQELAREVNREIVIIAEVILGVIRNAEVATPVPASWVRDLIPEFLPNAPDAYVTSAINKLVAEGVIAPEQPAAPVLRLAPTNGVPVATAR